MADKTNRNEIERQGEIDELTADDPLFDSALNLRIEKMRALHDAMALSSAELARRTGDSAFRGMQIDEQVRALTNLRI